MAMSLSNEKLAKHIEDEVHEYMKDSNAQFNLQVPKIVQNV